jgi:hypothetical protein
MWALIGVVLSVQGVGVQPISLHPSMEECFSAREVVMASMPKPKINYETVCIRTDVFIGV